MDIVIVVVVIATAKRAFSSNVDIMWLPICQARVGVAKANCFILLIDVVC